MMKKIKIAVLPGDGIGCDVTHAALPVFDALNVPVDLHFADIGWSCWRAAGDPVPAKTWELIASCDTVLLGATTSMPEKEAIEALPPTLRALAPPYLSPIIQLRQQLDLFANIRPCFNMKEQGSDFNLVVIRENTEGLYAGLDYYPLSDSLAQVINNNPRWKQVTKDNAACSLRLQTEEGLTRLFQLAFQYAQKNGFKRVTFADKPNVLRQSSVFARRIFEDIASQYPDVSHDIHNVDAVGLWLVRRPEAFGVIVAENMFGDILSDVAAGVMGGLGFAPSANLGKKGCYFEPVHGSAPRLHANTANPSAMFLTIGLLLEHFGYHEQSLRIKTAIKEVIRSSKYLTYDLGGTASTKEMADEIIEHCIRPLQSKRISFLATGNEIVSGDVQDTNTSSFAKLISEQGGSIYQRISVSDKKSEIAAALSYLLDASDAVVITGGLGPTADDVTRFAIAQVTKMDLYLDEQAWSHVVSRLNRYNLPVVESNRQQAFFPTGSEIYINELGTACGSYIKWNNKKIFMLPGPPRECMNMFNKNVLLNLQQDGFLYARKIHRWLTLGLIEGEISPIIEKIAKHYAVQTGYKWTYPYLEIKLSFNKNEAIDELLFKLDNLLEKHLVSTNGKDAFDVLEDSSQMLKEAVVVIDQIGIPEVFEKKRFHQIVFSPDPSCVDSNHSIHFYASQSLLNQPEYLGQIELNCIGYLGGISVLKHSISTPNRGPEIVQFASAYIAWQVNQFIEFMEK